MYFHYQYCNIIFWWENVSRLHVPNRVDVPPLLSLFLYTEAERKTVERMKVEEPNCRAQEDILVQNLLMILPLC